MVLLGGLEIVAAGYLLNEFNDNKKEERARRKHRRDSDGKHHHSRPSSSRPNAQRPSQSLQVPSQGPPRPSSAPPVSPLMPGSNFSTPPPSYHSRPHQNSNPGPQFHPGSLPPANPYLAQLANDRPPPLQGSNSFPLQHGRPGPGPPLQSSNSFPLNQAPPDQRPPPQQQQQPFKPPPTGPLQYIDSKTGRVQHNLYPPNHPMARGLAESYFDNSNVELNKAEHYTDKLGSMAQPGQAGKNRSRAHSNDDRGLAYGSYYPRERDLDHVRSYERQRRRS